MACKFPRRVREPLPAGTPPGRGAKPGEYGQAAFVPTDAQRPRVMDLVSCNFTLEQISSIPERTLSRHFGEELAARKLRVHAEIAQANTARAGESWQSLLGSPRYRSGP